MALEVGERSLGPAGGTGEMASCLQFLEGEMGDMRLMVAGGSQLEEWSWQGQ